jgi:hypothetical protein
VDVVGEDIAEDHNDTEGEEDLDEDEEEVAMVNDENEHDTVEQDDGKHNKPLEEAKAEEADKRVDKELESEECLLEYMREKEE